MNPYGAADELAGLLTRRGVSLRAEDGSRVGDGADALAAWEAFKELIAIPATDPVVVVDTVCTVDPEQDGDMLLFETSDKPEAFRILFTRQFSFTDPEGEYAGMNQMQLRFDLRPSEQTRDLPYQQAWGRVGEAAAAWVATVERSAPFRVANACSPERFVFWQTDV